MSKMNYANAAIRHRQWYERVEYVMDKAEGKVGKKPKKSKPSKIVSVKPCKCGSRNLHVKDGAGPHKYKLVCECGRFQRWMNSQEFQI